MLKIENKNLKNSFKKYFRIIKRKIEKTKFQKKVYKKI